MATIASPTTEHAGTAHTSLRSRCALARFHSPMVTVRRGFAWVGIGFIAPPRPVRLRVKRKGQPAEKTVVPALPREDLVVHGIAGKRGQGEAPSDLDPLDGRYAHQGLRQPSVDPFVPAGVR